MPLVGLDKMSDMENLAIGVKSEVVFEWLVKRDETRVAQFVLCTFERIEYLPWTIACLEAQAEKRFDLIIWNNNPARFSDISEIVRRCKPTFTVKLVNCDRNVGGIGRFLLVRRGYIDRSIPV